MKERFLQLSRREQIMLIVGGLFLTLILLVRLIGWPLLSHVDRLHEDIDTEVELIEWMEPRIARLPKGSASGEPVKKSVSQLERSLKKQGMQGYITHLAVGDHQTVNITLTGVPIPVLLSWQDTQFALGWQLEHATLTPAPKTGTGDIVMVLK